MAVTITQAELSAALRLGTSAEEVAEATRLLTYATEAVTQHAAAAPPEVLNEAVIRLAGYFFDQPFAGSRPRLRQRPPQQRGCPHPVALPRPSCW